MALDTMHDREFYEAKVEEHELLEQVIAGETTLTATLDSLLEPIVVTGEELLDYLQMVGKLAEQQDDKIPKGFPYKKSLALHLTEVGAGVGGSFGVGGVLYGLALLLFPAVPILGWVLATMTLPCSSIAAGWASGNQEEANLKKLRERRREVLQPVYEISTSIDQDIDKCFILEHFHDARPRFEQTYAALTADERAPVHDYLFGLLGVGGMPGMDEIQLKGYLSGLLVPQAEGDA